MRLTSNRTFNNVIKIIIKLGIAAAAIVGIAFGLIGSVHSINEKGWAQDITGQYVLTAQNKNMFILKYIFSIPVLVNLLIMIFCVVAAISHHYEGKLRAINYSTATGYATAGLLQLIIFLSTELPFEKTNYLGLTIGVWLMNVVVPILFILYYLILMENKPRYGNIEIVVRKGWKYGLVFTAYILLAAIMWIMATNQQMGDNHFIQMINKQDIQEYLDSKGTDKYLSNLDAAGVNPLLDAFFQNKLNQLKEFNDLIGTNWTNSHIYSLNNLIRFDDKESVLGFPGYVGTIIFLLIALACAYGGSSLLNVINRRIVVGRHYVINKKIKLTAYEVEDTRDITATFQDEPVVDWDDLEN